jgi:glucokinase
VTSVLAVDLGGTKTATAFVDAGGVAADKQKVAAEHSLNRTVEHIAAHAVGARIDAVGVIVPGIYNASTGNAWAPNLWGSDEVPLRDALEQRLGAPVRISSDRTGYVLGEQWLGVARGLSDVLFVAIGTGIGVGILAGGRVIEGAHGIAGAAGWMAVSCEWKPDYARCGCWESEAAGPAIARHAVYRSHPNRSSTLGPAYHRPSHTNRTYSAWRRRWLARRRTPGL